MNKILKRRLITVSFFLIGLALAAGLIIYAIRKNLNVFVTPSQIISQHIDKDYHLRLGGMVKKDSIKREPGSLRIAFVVTDLKHDVPVRYEGVLPDLFKEEKGMLAEGKLNAQGVFIATRVLAKHDENYMPKKVYDSMRQARG